MSTSTSDTIGGFTDADIEDVTKTVLKGLNDGAGRPIDYDALTPLQQAGYKAAARASITSERTPGGFASHLTEGFREPEKRTPAENQELNDQVVAAQHLEEEFPKLTANEFAKRRAAE